MENFAPAFAAAQVQIADLADLTEEDLKEIRLPLGPRRRARSAIKATKEATASAVVGAPIDPVENPKPAARPDTGVRR